MGEVRQGTIPESLPQEHRNYFNLKTCPPAFQFNKQLPLAGTMQRSLGLNDLFICKDGGKKVEGGPRRSCVLQFSLSRQHLPFPREMGERIGKIKVQELLGRDNNTLLDKAFVSKAKQGIHLLLLISRKAGLIMCNGTLGKQVLSCLPSPPSSFFTLVFITEHDLMLYNMGYPFDLSGSAILAASPLILFTPILLAYAYYKERYSRAYRQENGLSSSYTVLV